MIEAIVGVALRAILASVLLGGLLSALVLIATRTLALTAAARHLLWTTALVAMAVMPLAGVGVSIARAYAAPVTALDGNAGVPAARSHPAATIVSPARRSPAHTAAAAAPATSNSAAHDVAPAPSFAERTSGVLGRWTPRMSRALAIGFAGVWALGALIGMLGLAGSIAGVRGLKRRSSPLDGTLSDELPWLTEARSGREIYLRLSYEIETPVAIGFRRPVILIPTELATADGLAAIEPLVLHEHAHLRRYDDWTNLVQRVIERLFWFNPVVWLVGRRIALEREIASDDAVVEKTGEAHAYATSLWKLAREMRMPEHAVVAPGALLTRRQITVRIEQLLDTKRSRLHRSPGAALGVTLAGFLAVGLVATSAPAVELPAPAPAAATSPAPVAAPATARHENPAAQPKPAFATRATVQHAPAVTAVRPAPASIPRTVAARSYVHVQVQVSDTPSHALPALSPSHPPHELRGVATPPVPAVPPVPALPSGAAHVRVTAAMAEARQARDLAAIGPQISRTVTTAMAAVPKQIAQEGGTATHRARLDGVKLSREMIASCVGCSFRNTDARGVDLHGLRISANDFTGADFRGANLSGAQLVGVSLIRANLANADLRNASLSGVELRDANFDGALLDGIKLVGVSIQHVSLHGVALRSVIANCMGCDFGRLDLHGQDLHGISLSGADLSHADLHDANLSGVRFVGVDLAHANLSGADLTNAHLDGCDLSGVDLRGAHTTGLTMHGSGIDG